MQKLITRCTTALALALTAVHAAQADDANAQRGAPTEAELA